MDALLHAIITYCLSEKGQQASLKAGGSRAYHQNASGIITSEDLPLFTVTSDGIISVVFNHVEFDQPATFTELIEHLRERQKRRALIRTLIEAEAIAETAFETS